MKHQFNIRDGVICDTIEEANKLLSLAGKKGYKIYEGSFPNDAFKSFYFDKDKEFIFCTDACVENPIPKEEFIKLITQETMKSTKITPPEGYEVDKEKSTFEEIVFKKIEKKYPTSVEEIDRPYYLGTFGDICTGGQQTINHLSSEKRGEQILALIQVLELRDAFNKADDFVADWSDTKQEKQVIILSENELTLTFSFCDNKNLHFKSRETAQLFLDQFRELIEECQELI